jgi:hypothetical protein
MKMISMGVVILGVIALVLAIVDRALGIQIATVTAQGYLRGAIALYLLALAVMCYDKCYGGKPQP